MAYGYNYGGYPMPGAGMYAPPMQDQLAQLRGQQGPFPQMQQQTPPAQNGSNMIWVTRKEAEEYLVCANCSVALWDKDENVAYIKSADSTGRPTMRILDYSERTSTLRAPVQSNNKFQGTEYATKKELEALTEKTKELESEIAMLKERNNV